MKKKAASIALAGFVTGLLIAQSALAVVMPNWNRPIMVAETEIENATGIFSETKSTRLSLSQNTTTRTTLFEVFADQKTLGTFEIKNAEVEQTSCNREVVTHSGKSGQFSTDLIVREKLPCDALTPHEWRAELVAYDQDGSVAGELTVVGTPVSVYTFLATTPR